MCQVYSDAYLTIAATKSRNPAGSCFRTSDFRSGRTYSFHNASGALYKVHVREALPHVNDDERKIWFPLLQRGWASQERILSPRVVHYGPEKLLWECLTLKMCEHSRGMGMIHAQEARPLTISGHGLKSSI